VCICLVDPIPSYRRWCRFRVVRQIWISFCSGKNLCHFLICYVYIYIYIAGDSALERPTGLVLRHLIIFLTFRGIQGIPGNATQIMNLFGSPSWESHGIPGNATQNMNFNYLGSLPGNPMEFLGARPELWILIIWVTIYYIYIYVWVTTHCLTRLCLECSRTFARACVSRIFARDVGTPARGATSIGNLVHFTLFYVSLLRVV
jgi:hypothetical protein